MQKRFYVNLSQITAPKKARAPGQRLCQPAPGAFASSRVGPSQLSRGHLNHDGCACRRLLFLNPQGRLVLRTEVGAGRGAPGAQVAAAELFAGGIRTSRGSRCAGQGLAEHSAVSGLGGSLAGDRRANFERVTDPFMPCAKRDLWRKPDTESAREGHLGPMRAPAQMPCERSIPRAKKGKGETSTVNAEHAGRHKAELLHQKSVAPDAHGKADHGDIGH